MRPSCLRTSAPTVHVRAGKDGEPWRGQPEEHDKFWGHSAHASDLQSIIAEQRGGAEEQADLAQASFEVADGDSAADPAVDPEEPGDARLTPNVNYSRSIL